MRNRSSQHSSLFLLELIAAIFFFCLASAICIRFFVKSHSLTQDARNLDMAVNQTSNFAELFRSEDDFSALLEEQYEKGSFSHDKTNFIFYYNKDFTFCQKDNAAFTLTIHMESREEICTAEFTVFNIDKKEQIYSLETEKFIAKGGLSNEKEE